MSDQTLVLILVFVFAVIALIALGASSFIRLVALILENGSKVEAVAKDVRQVQTTLSNGTANNGALHPKDDSPTTPAPPSSS